MKIINEEWLKELTPGLDKRLGNTRHALFDFDGTLSVMREGWEGVMLPVMLESICGDRKVLPEVEDEVRDYIDSSTGILTIQQMEWLSTAVKRYGYVREPLSASQYKAIYLDRLMVRVRERIHMVQNGQINPEKMILAGGKQFVEDLWNQGVTLYLASGTDHQNMVSEATVLHLAQYFNERVYGALDQNAENGKERVIQRILDENNLAGNELLVVGDGPVEIREAKLRGAITLGVASNEIARSGWNPQKIQRLTNAGVDLMVPDFSHHSELASLLCKNGA